MFNNNNILGANFGFDGSVQATNGEPSTSASQASGSSLDVMLAGLSATEIEEWWLGPGQNGSVGPYTGSTLLDSDEELSGGSGSQTESTPNSNASELHRYFDPLVPESQRSTVSGPPRAPSPLPIVYPSLHFPATFAGPTTTPSPIPTPSWGYSPIPSTSYTAVRDNRAGTHNQPLTGPNLGGQWPYFTSVGEGDARAADQFPPTHPPSTGDAMWQHQLPYIPQGYDAGSYPQMGFDAPNTIPSTQAAPSTGPQRSVKRSKGKGKEVDKGEGSRKRAPRKPVPLGINWPDTRDRFCAEMAKICFNQPTGEVINPETAYASSLKFVKEDLYLSPLVVKPLGDRQSRDLEQYLIGILNALRPRQRGQQRGVQHMLDRVAQELESELVAVNDDFALLDGHSNEVDLEKLDGSEGAAERRIKEQGRREAIRRSLERMTLLFRVPRPRTLWSRPQALFYAIMYIVFGAGVFGDGFFTPKPQL